MIALPITPWPQIRADLGFEEKADTDAALHLARILRHAPYACGPAWTRLMQETAGRDVVVLGGARDGARDLVRMKGQRLWTCDGATGSALEAGKRVSCVVSDLDGATKPQVQAVANGATLLVVAHGDNVHALDVHLPKFAPSHVVGVCQIDPAPPPLLNLGGFTDGDRAVLSALRAGARSVKLVGFDFSEPGPFSAKGDLARKMKKLRWAERILSDLSSSGAPVSRL